QVRGRGDAGKRLRAAVEPGFLGRLEHLPGDPHRDRVRADRYRSGVADGEAALRQERGVDVYLTRRAVPVPGDDAEASPGGVAAEHLGADVLRDAGHLDLPLIHR